MDFVAFSKEFKRIFPCLAVTGGIPSFFFNDFKRAERASERSEPRAKLFVWVFPVWAYLALSAFFVLNDFERA